MQLLNYIKKVITQKKKTHKLFGFPGKLYKQMMNEMSLMILNIKNKLN